MDDWYLDFCKRHVNRLSVIDEQLPTIQRQRSGSFKHAGKIQPGNWNAFSCLLV